MHPEHPALSAIDLRDLGPADLDRLAALPVSLAQEDFGGSFADTLAEWRASDPAALRGLGFLLAGAPVGLVLLKRPPLSPEWVPEAAVSLHGLKIGGPYQGRGLGRRAVELTLAAARQHWPEARSLALAVDDGNAPALGLYLSLGMVASGPPIQGRIGWEHRLLRALA